MRMRHAAGLVGLVVVGLAGSASRARAGEIEWSGFQAGLQAGYGYAPRTWSLRVSGSDSIEDAQSEGLLPREMKSTASAWMAGAFVGGSRQEGPVVFGAEAAFAFSGLGSEARVVRDTETPGLQVVTRVREDVDWLGAARIQVGTAFGRALVYGTGGLALGQVRLSGSIVTGENTAHEGVQTDTVVGWTAGAGAWLALSRTVRLGGEMSYHDFGPRTFKLSPAHPLFEEESARFDYRANGWNARLALAALF